MAVRSSPRLSPSVLRATPPLEGAFRSSFAARFTAHMRSSAMLHNRRGVFVAVAALTLGLVAGARAVQAQDAVIRGTITSDRGEPVAVANVFIEELRMAVTSAANGQYTLLVPGARARGQQVVLRVRGIGFKPNSKSITLTPGDQTVDLTLAYDVNLLEAVVVT